MSNHSFNLKRAIDAKQARDIFFEIDRHLDRKMEITILGGTAIILLGYRERSTMDIDVFRSLDAGAFTDVALKLGYPVHLLPLSPAVDPENAEKTLVIDGRFLRVFAVSGLDLLKTKVDRYTRQDREDIRAILAHLQPSKEKMFRFAHEVMLDYIGPPEKIQTTLELIIEEYFGLQVMQEFKDYSARK